MEHVEKIWFGISYIISMDMGIGMGNGKAL